MSIVGEDNMQPIPYKFKGKQVFKQVKCTCDKNKLDKSRIWLDFNEICDQDIYLLSQADIVNDSNGDDVELYEGLHISVFDFDKDANNNDDYLLAEGIVKRNELAIYPHIKWLCHLLDNTYTDYKVYWMSDIK